MMDEKMLRATMLGVASTVIGALGNAFEAAGNSTAQEATVIRLAGYAFSAASRMVEHTIQDERQ